MGAPLMIPGIEKDFGGGRVFLVPPLSLGALELMQERLAQLPALVATDSAAVRTVIDAAHLALKRNYPDITREQVGELVDVSNMGDVYECLMDVAGIKRKALQAEKDAAEGKATAQTTPPVPVDGPPSSPASAPSPAGPGST